MPRRGPRLMQRPKSADALAKRLAEISKREAAVPRRKVPLVQIFIVLAALLVGVIGAHYWKIASDEARVTELTVALDAATKATQQLDLARQRQEELLQRVEVARLAESDARAKGDQAKLKELQEQTKRTEAEALKQGELVKQREAEAKKAEVAAKGADAKKQGDMAKVAEKAAQEKLAQEMAALAKAAEVAAAEKAAATKAAEKAATAKASREGVLPGRYAFRILPASAGGEQCGRINVQEDVDFQPGGSQTIAGREFTELLLQSAQDGNVVATVKDVRAGNMVLNRVSLTFSTEGYGRA